MYVLRVCVSSAFDIFQLYELLCFSSAIFLNYTTRADICLQYFRLVSRENNTHTHARRPYFYWDRTAEIFMVMAGSKTNGTELLHTEHTTKVKRYTKKEEDCKQKTKNPQHTRIAGKRKSSQTHVTIVKWVRAQHKHRQNASASNKLS